MSTILKEKKRLNKCWRGNGKKGNPYELLVQGKLVQKWNINWCTEQYRDSSKKLNSEGTWHGSAGEAATRKEILPFAATWIDHKGIIC